MAKVVIEKNLQTGQFSVNVPTVDMVAVTDYCGKAVVRKVRPFLLTMPDNRFWAVGEQVGSAWKDGATYRQELKR